MKKFVRYITFFVTVCMMVRCANVVTPAGGPKDIKPPVAVESSPENNATNFNGKSIHITFNEFITLNNPTNNVLISPPMDKKPTYRTSGKTLIIKFEEALRPETTYSINFGNAIKDLHEGNVLKNYIFNFSTGESIDSLSLKGKIISAATLTPMEGMTVSLYSDDNDTVMFDSLPYRVRPNYITITDKKGNFEFSGLADKEYLIFALKDNNSNIIFDLPNEEIAFYPELVKPYFIENQVVIDTVRNDSISDTIAPKEIVADIKKDDYPIYEMFAYLQDDSIQKLFKKELVEEGLLRFIFRYPADNVSITPLEELPDTFNILPVYSIKKDTVLWYFTPCKDSLWICINDGLTICDTTHYSLKPRESVSRWKRKQEEKRVKRLVVKNNTKGNKLKPYQPLILRFNEPIVKINRPDSIDPNIRFERLDDYGFKYLILDDLKQENKYQLMIPDSVFFGIRGYTNDTIKLGFQVQEESAFGNIYFMAEIPENVPQVIIELTDEKGKTLDKQIITKSQEVAFEFLDPGKYKLKATIDLNANGEWSPGHFGMKLQPEKIIFYDKTLEVRANWDIDMEEPWKIAN